MQDFAFPTLEALPEAPTFVAPEAVAPEPEIDLAAEAEAARAAGHEAGFQAGLIEAQAQMASGVAALQAAVAAVAAERERVVAAVEPAAVDLALRIAEQAIGAAVAAQPEVVVDVVRGALRRLAERDRVTILVNPEDLELVRTASETLVAELGGIEHCDVQAERRVGRGGAVVRTTEGEVDATLATKLASARKVLEDELRVG
ncbi:MAG TPA: FliH/SctL family protein [Baekduia sp.]|uniref:FliH/SctL family protein n=1 Tax=Baekduia sp. TaxID=2600305 RepID=UPI002D776AFE|nr:FliH/SctL family protein [Baekduia sp.]HET6508860.1 FliH/SctL family protein [Baekduia sp.]